MVLSPLCLGTNRRHRHAPTLFPYTTLFRSGGRSTPCHAVYGAGNGAAVHLQLKAVPQYRGTAFNCRRSEEHTFELQSPVHLVFRLLLEKKNLLQFVYEITVRIDTLPIVCLH